MRLLLDTHALIWAFSNDPRLSPEAREAIVEGSNMVFVSAATAWEIAIKRALGKLRAPDNYEDELARHRFLPLDITTAHALAVEHLPPLHADPFDRILVAQAQLEQLTVVTRDARIPSYGVAVIAA